MISSISNKIKKLILMAFIACAIVCFLFSLTFINNASASLIANASIYSPFSKLEQTELTSPKDFCYWNGNVAVIEEQSVVVHFADGASKIYSEGFIALKQIKVLADDKLLVSNNGPLYVIDLTEDTVKPLTYYLSGEKIISGNYFDFNGEYLVTAYGEVLSVYRLQGQTFTFIEDKQSALNGDEPIAINESGSIFYITGSTDNNKTLCKRSVSNLAHMDELLVGIDPSHIIADDTFVYFVASGNVNRIPVNGGTPTALLTDESFASCDLGYLPTGTSISGICFKDTKILTAVSALHAIQEFKIENDKLIFTGYAITKNKTAYNRIKADAYDVESFGDALAVLDSKKLTVIKDVNATDYNRENYFNAYSGKGDYAGFNPNALALGNGTVILVNKESKKIKLIDYNNGIILADLELNNSGNNITDVCYSKGIYYVVEIASGSGKDVSIFTISESDFSLSEQPIIKATSILDDFGSGSIITVDINQNVYLTDNAKNDIYLFLKSNDYIAPTEPIYKDVMPAKKLATDLTLGLFGITDSSVIYYENGIEETVNLNITDVKSFAICFNQKTAYFIRNNDEVIYQTDNLPNTSATEFKVADKYREKPQNANIENLKICSVLNDTNLFKVSDNGAETFNFSGIYQGYRNEYVLISNISYEQIGRNTVEFSILIGYDENNNPITIVVDKNAVVFNSDAIKQTSGNVFVTTGVSAYYIPIITEEDCFCIINEDNVLRLPKETKLTVYNKFKFLEKDFLYVSFESEGKTIYAFVPENFTVETLYKDSPISNYNDSVFEGKNYLTNSIIIILVGTSVFATTAYFVLRKKN